MGVFVEIEEIVEIEENCASYVECGNSQLNEMKELSFSKLGGLPMVELAEGLNKNYIIGFEVLF